jgi:hypothetical protein
MSERAGFETSFPNSHLDPKVRDVTVYEVGELGLEVTDIDRWV